ncbi:MAG TPA: protein kinase [Polyangiales bacterium]|nr:protein kinase [Polyangiales bacterium]
MSTRTGRPERPTTTTIDELPPGAALVAGRYELLREIGAGGVGNVYLARDRQTRETVALKQLTRADAKSVLRFKREFRSVAHVQHPNLVKLYDLECEPNGIWFLTMEYVPGIDLVSHLRPDDEPADIARVLETFRQVARGVHALHANGMLHRDLKPSNVLVAGERVLVLDFGLVRGIDERNARVTEEGMVSGTPAYMAPEQALARPLTEAADWYALGVMLFEVLAGDLPFDGAAVEIMRQKIDYDAQPLAEIDPEIPHELASLCAALLQRDPTQRPTGPEVLARLGASRPPAPRPADLETTSFTDHAQTAAVHFIGREASLSQLRAALADVERGQSVAVHVRGLSGAGKSALLERFVGEAERTPAATGGSDVLVLRSRCYEREAMPFKALDSIMDALVLDLGRRDDLTVGHLLPADIHALARLFPALERVRAVKKLLGVQRTQSNARSDRQRAEAALRELIARLAQSRPLILWVDDLHWGDLDSVAILRAWLEQETGAPFLLLLSYRSDEMATSPALRALLATSEPGASRVAERQIEVGPLGREDMYALCSERLGARALGRGALIERIVEQAEGSPFLASQLASLALAMLDRGEGDLKAVSFEALVAQTQALLSPEATAVLAVLAVAGRPMVPRLALRVADVRHGGRAVLHALRNLNLVRTRDADGERLIEIYHNRIREHVYGQLGASVLRAIHNGLLRALENSGRADPDWLHSLALGADDKVLALQYGLNAAERAHAALAFERAAELYASCLELCQQDEVRCELWRELGHVLGYSGRGVRAAEALLEAAKLCQSTSDALQLKRQAASHFLRCGRFEQGDALSEEVMAAAGIQRPRSEGKLMAALVWERTLLGLRGLSFKQRNADEISPAVLARLDLLEDLRIALNTYDTLLSVWLGTQSLRLALDAGEPSRIIRALCNVGTLKSGEGTRRGAAAAREMLERASALASEFGTPRDRMELDVARAAVSFYETRFPDVLEPAAEADRALRELPPDSSDATYFFKFSARALRVGALSQLDWVRFRKECHVAKQEAVASENVLAVLLLALNESVCDEIVGQAELSVTRLEAQRELLPRQRFTVMHVLHLTAVYYAACATRRHAWGIGRVADYWDAFLRSPLRANTTLLMLAHTARARLLLNEYVEQRSNKQLLREALRSIKAVERATPLNHERLFGRVAYLDGDITRAQELLERSAATFERTGYQFEVMRDRCALALLAGDEDGARRAREVLEAFERDLGYPAAYARGLMRANFPELIGPL